MGTTVILDVIGCQKNLAQHIRSQQANDVLTVKEYQTTLRTILEETFMVERQVQFEGCPIPRPVPWTGTTDASRWALDNSEYLRYVASQRY